VKGTWKVSIGKDVMNSEIGDDNEPPEEDSVQNASPVDSSK
jgi:hypothetical protein